LCLAINWLAAFLISFPKLLNRLFCCDRDVISSSGLFRLSTLILGQKFCIRMLYNGSISKPKTRGPESLEHFQLIF